ncbi:unnamed protein product, partial [Iphiclides podalirius]
MELRLICDCQRHIAYAVLGMLRSAVGNFITSDLDRVENDFGFEVASRSRLAAAAKKYNCCTNGFDRRAKYHSFIEDRREVDKSLKYPILRRRSRGQQLVLNKSTCGSHRVRGALRTCRCLFALSAYPLPTPPTGTHERGGPQRNLPRCSRSSPTGKVNRSSPQKDVCAGGRLAPLLFARYKTPFARCARQGESPKRIELAAEAAGHASFAND